MTASIHCLRGLGSALLMAFLALAGCKEVLYSDLSENEANEMVAILDAGDIQAKRQRSKDGIYDITVDSAMIASAVTLLQAAGYPKKRYQSLGDVFAGDELVGSPFNERARFMHAMNEELSRTIGEIDGVRSARVQVMIPAQDKYDPTPKTATASIAVMYDERRDLTALVPIIKTLVAHSVSDLAYDNVAVALFPIAAPRGPASLADSGVAGSRAMGIFLFDLPPVWLGAIFALFTGAGLLAASKLLWRKRLNEGSP